jgi:hypothetical protein
VRFSVADQGRDVGCGEQGIREDFGWGKTMVGLEGFNGGLWLTYGRVAIDSEEREICSRCRSNRDILEY